MRIKFLRASYSGKMIVLLLYYAAIQFSVFSARAQTTVKSPVLVSGSVVDSKGLPLIGVSVKVKGTPTGTVTDGQGNFSLNVPADNAVLTFSYVSYITQEQPVIRGRVMRIVLMDRPNDLNEVVVVGYGTQKKQNLTGALSNIGTKELVQSPTANISNSLVGRLPGLFATQQSGEPGNDQSVLRIRGIGTFSGNTDPLILIDGVEALTYNNIDPNEIESVTILKDAASTAVYGIRGANGVLIITTKRGKKGAPVISYSFQGAANQFTDLRKSMDAYDYANSLNQATKNDSYKAGNVYVPVYSDADLKKFQTGEDPIFYPNIDWYSLFLKKTSFQQQHNLNVNGGTDKAQYFISLGYFNQDGLYQDTRKLVPGYNANPTFKRYNLRSNFNFNVNKRFKISFDVSSQTENRTGANATTQNIIEQLAKASPVGTPGFVDGKVVQPFNSTSAINPYVNLLQGGYQRSINNYLNGTLKLDHSLDFITTGLSVNGFVAYQNFNQQKILNSKNLVVYYAKQVTDANGNNSVIYLPQSDDGVFGFTESNDKYRRLTAQAAINYDRSFGSHSVTALVVYNQNKLYNPNLAFGVPKGYQSLAGRTTYNFKNRYLAEFDLAYNGTEQFAPGKRFGVFPAVSGGWIPTEESFFPKNKILTYLKIRGSYGEVGNDVIGGDRFLYRPTSYTSNTPVGGTSAIPSGYYFGTVGQNYLPYNGLLEGKAGNPDLTWERARKRDIGLDFKMFDDHLSFTGDYFWETRNNILAVPSTVSAIVGYNLPAYNLGKMSNHGFELDLGYSGDVNQKFTYFIGGNFSFARNKILYQDELKPLYDYQLRTGNRLGQIFGLVAEGLFNSWQEVNDPNRPVYNLSGVAKLQPGDIRFKDVNGDGVVDINDQVPIGYSTVPEITYGLTLRGTYKGLDFSLLFQGVGNVSAPFSAGYGRRFIAGFFDAPTAGAVDYLLNSWTQERYAAGQQIDFPRYSRDISSANTNYTTSTFFLKDASYIRLKNVEVGYTFRSDFLKKIGLSSFRIYANANNVLTWSKLFPGVDPESVAVPQASGVTSQGDLVTNREPYPLTKTLNFGLNVKF